MSAMRLRLIVIPAKAGTQVADGDARFRGHDGKNERGWP